MEPFISIIVPTRNRPRQVAACAAVLGRLQYPRDRYEVIFVDDGSEPPVVAPGARVIRQPGRGPAAARNTGVREARGELLAFTDDDCAPAPDWLRHIAQHLTAEPDRLLGGRVINALPDNLFAEASQQLVSYLYEYFNSGAAGPQFFTSNNLAVRRQLLLSVGGFDESLPRAAAEDRELCDRWLHLGHRLAYAPEMIVHHAHDLTPRSFWQQHFNYGRGAHYYHSARAERRGAKLRVEPVRSYGNLLRYPFTQTRGLRAWRLTTLLLLAQIANALGFFWERWQHRGVPATRQC
jgi:GT2 family glycosyltransferase